MTDLATFPSWPDATGRDASVMGHQMFRGYAFHVVSSTSAVRGASVPLGLARRTAADNQLAIRTFYEFWSRRAGSQ